MNKILILCALIGVSLADHEFQIHNKCSHPVYFATLGKGNPENVNLNAGQSHSFKAIAGFSGRMWGKIHCDANGKGCDDTPATLAEFTLGPKEGDMDFYDVSLVDGFNVAMRVEPIAGTFKRGAGNNHYDCTAAGCKSDMNAICPQELAVKRDGKTVACLSACAKFKTDEYCCGGKHNTPQTCKSTDWPKNYPAIFKQACPDAYSYAYDDQKSTFTCHGMPQTGYTITFCP